MRFRKMFKKRRRKRGIMEGRTVRRMKKTLLNMIRTIKINKTRTTATMNMIRLSE